jgi:predicted DNA-binding transcriptional regulator YafY
LGLVAKGSIWYLVAWGAKASSPEVSTHAVSRIAEAGILPEAALRPEGFDLEAYWTTAGAEVQPKAARYYALFRVNPEVMPSVRCRGWALDDESVDGDRIRVRVGFEAEEEALNFALSFSTNAEVLDPPELAAKVVAAANAILHRRRMSAT